MALLFCSSQLVARALATEAGEGCTAPTSVSSLECSSAANGFDRAL